MDHTVTPDEIVVVGMACMFVVGMGALLLASVALMRSAHRLEEAVKFWTIAPKEPTFRWPKSNDDGTRTQTEAL